MKTFAENDTCWTEEKLLSLPDDGNKYELVVGELVATPAGIEHERIGLRHHIKGLEK